MKRGSLDNFFKPIEKHKNYSQPESSSSVSPSPHSNIYTSSASTTDESPAVSSTSACPGSADPLTVSQDVSQSPSNFGQLLKLKLGGLSLNPHQVSQLLDDREMPGKHEKFPVDKDGRRFRREWLEKFSWLKYAKEIDGAVCITCVIFQNDISTVGGKCKPHAQLATCPLKDLKNAMGILRNHDISPMHRACTERARIHQLHAADRNLDVDRQLNTAKKAQIAANRSKLRGIVQTVLYLGRNNVAFRGHRDSGDVLDSNNDGIFRDTLRFRVDGGDEALKHLLSESPQYASYTSPRIQNELISIVGELIRDEVINKVKKAKFFSVLMDETTDCARTEQASIILRTVNSEGVVSEDFVAFVEAKDVTGQGLATLMLDTLNSLGLDASNLRGQGYDGAASMSGRFKGCQAIVRAKHPLAVYVHCFCHRLNLVIGNACDLPLFKVLFGTVRQICDFFANSPKRSNILERTIESDETASMHKKRRLKAYCPTRWVERHNSIAVLVELFPFVVSVLNQLSEDGDDNAACLLGAMTRPSFTCSLAVANAVLCLTLPVSQGLQDPAQHLGQAYERIREIKRRLQEMREESLTVFKPIFTEALMMSTALGIDITVPRKTPEGSTPESFYERTLLIPFLDTLITKLSTLFDESNSEVVILQELLPRFACEDTLQKLQPVLQLYEEDLTNGVHNAECQIQEWLKQINGIEDQQDWSLQKCIQEANRMLLPDVGTLLRLFGTVPLSTASSERSFSHLRRLKTYLRSTMTQERLDALALMTHDIEVDPEKVMDMFRDRGNRRLKF